MADLHKLLYEPWMGTDASHNQFERRPSLATHMPEAVPAGLEFGGSSGKKAFLRNNRSILALTDKQAKWLCIGKWMEVLDIGSDIVVAGKGELVQRLAATMHELADFRDAAKETK